MTNKNGINGFTLLEILVTIAIFLVLSATMIVDFKFKIPKDALNQGVEQAIVFYRQAQTATMAGASAGSASPTYGLYLSTEASQKNQIIVFADLDMDKNYDANEEDRTNCSDCGIFSLPNGVDVITLTPQSDSSLTIVFSATNTNEIYFNGSIIPTEIDGQIILKQSDTEETGEINVFHLSGQISR